MDFFVAWLKVLGNSYKVEELESVRQLGASG
jgi:hypothetical protein